MKSLSITKNTLLITIAFLLITGAVSTSIYFYSKYQKSQKLLQNPTLYAKEEQLRLITLVGKLIELPADEEPTIATISELEKLKDQPFFTKAKNGDKVLFYTKAKKAILYRPDINKIIEVAPINLETSQTATTSASPNTNPTVSAEKVKIAIYNGTNIAGQAKKAEASISAKLVSVNVVTKDDAVKKDYQKTVVVDLTGNFKIQAGQLTQLFKGEIGTLPEGEKKPAADILVIIGSNFNL